MHYLFLPPVLASLARAVDRELVGGHGMYRRHKTLHNPKIIVQNLGHRGQAVGGAGRVGHHIRAGCEVGKGGGGGRESECPSPGFGRPEGG